jgi:hypothetical protein
MDGPMLVRVFNVVECFIIIALSIRFFIEIDSIWRWVKLIYAINTFLVSIVMINGIVGGLPFMPYPLPILFQLLVTTVLLSTLLSGLLVSSAKINYYKKVEKQYEQMDLELKELGGREPHEC